MSASQNVAVLGATGSIGLSTLSVLSKNLDQYRIFALTGFSRLDKLEELIITYQPDYAVVPTKEQAGLMQKSLSEQNIKTSVLVGDAGLCEIAAHDDVDIVMAAIVGSAGLSSTLAAAKAGKKLLLANKEALVMAGDLLMNAVIESGAVLLPIDSEHNAIFQCLPTHGSAKTDTKGVHKIVLTASGGPFRLIPLEQLSQVTPEQACSHPNWSMGKKISVDSATMLNKGLELIEACWLFDVNPEQVDIVVHPQSVIHSMVSYKDGSTLAQMGYPDMRIPIAHALSWPERINSGVGSLDLLTLDALTFEEPNEKKFPGLKLSRQAALLGGTAPVILNAANEIAVHGFLNKKLSFLSISQLIDAVLDTSDFSTVTCLDDVLVADKQARIDAMFWLKKNGHDA